MSLFPELILRDTVIKGLKALKEDLTLVDQLMRNMPVQTIQDVKDFITTQPITIELNYPRQDITLPAICIVLKSEEESNAYLNDVLGSNTSPPDDMTLNTDELGEITPYDDTLVGDPQNIFRPNDIVTRKGSGYTSNYAIQIMSLDPHLSAFLYVFIKAILTRRRLDLEVAGLINLKISGQDVLLQAEHLPDYVFSRNLNVQFLYYFDVFEKVAAIDKFIIEVDVKHQDGSTTTISETEIDLTP